MFGLIVQLVASHILGDFVFQSNKMIKHIERKKIKSVYLYIHALIHLVLMLVFTNFKSAYIIPLIVLSIVHLVIDMFTKILIKNSINSAYNLLLDQLLHAVSIAVFVRYFYDYTIDFNAIGTVQNYVLLIGVLCSTHVSAIIIKKILDVLHFKVPKGGMKDAGRYIGMLERLFVFTFVVLSFWEGIGFLLAAKSIFRFGDLKESKEIRLTEYILIGTLLSFGLAIVCGLVYLKLMNIE